MKESRTALQRLQDRLPALVDSLAHTHEQLGQLTMELDAADAAQKRDAETITNSRQSYRVVTISSWDWKTRSRDSPRR